MSAASQSGSVLHCRSLSYREISLLSEFSYSKESKKTSAYTLSRFCPQQPCTFHSGPHPQPLDKSLRVRQRHLHVHSDLSLAVGQLTAVGQASAHTLDSLSDSSHSSHRGASSSGRTRLVFVLREPRGAECGSASCCSKDKAVIELATFAGPPRLRKVAHTQGHGAGSNWLVFLKAHPWGSMTQCQLNSTATCDYGCALGIHGNCICSITLAVDGSVEGYTYSTSTLLWYVMEGSDAENRGRGHAPDLKATWAHTRTPTHHRDSDTVSLYQYPVS